MGTVHVGIGHDDDLVIPQLADIKVISISFGKSAAKCIDHRLDLCIRQHFIDTCFFHVQDLTTDWKDCLEHTVSGCAEKAAKIRKTEERAKTNLLTKQKYSLAYWLIAVVNVVLNPVRCVPPSAL